MGFVYIYIFFFVLFCFFFLSGLSRTVDLEIVVDSFTHRVNLMEGRSYCNALSTLCVLKCTTEPLLRNHFLSKENGCGREVAFIGKMGV